MGLQVGNQAQQGFALVLHAPMAGSQHFKRDFEADGRRAVAGKGQGRGGIAPADLQAPRSGRAARREVGAATTADSLRPAADRLVFAVVGDRLCVMSANVAPSRALK